MLNGEITALNEWLHVTGEKIGDGEYDDALHEGSSISAISEAMHHVLANQDVEAMSLEQFRDAVARNVFNELGPQIVESLKSAMALRAPRMTEAHKALAWDLLMNRVSSTRAVSREEVQRLAEQAVKTDT